MRPVGVPTVGKSAGEFWTPLISRYIRRNSMVSIGAGMATDKKTRSKSVSATSAGQAPQKWQQRKSSHTRVTILEAAIDCLERHGYAQTTMQLIADVANMSRGAMTHHYASKIDLISGVTDYLFRKRMEIFVERVSTLSDRERVDINLGIEMAWEGYFTREYKAYLELSIAAQTDMELEEIFIPKARHYDRVWREQSLVMFPEWSGKPQLFECASDFIEAALEGMVLNRRIWNSPEREAMARALLASVIKQMRDGQIALPSKTQAGKFRGPASRARKTTKSSKS